MAEISVAPEVIENQDKFVEKKVHELREISLKNLGRGAGIEERFLYFCTRYLEEPEREGKLPREYSRLNLAEVEDVVSSLIIKADDEGVEGTEGNFDKELELVCLRQAAQAIQTHKDRTAIIHGENKAINPLRKIEDGTLIFVSDDHEPPSYAAEGTRAHAFKRYAPKRFGVKLLETIQKRRKFADMPRMMSQEFNPGEKLPEKNLERRYMERTDSRRLFDTWMIDWIAGEKFREDKKEKSVPIIFSLGDRVHDGAFFIDQLSVDTKYYEMIDAIIARNPEVNPRLLEINGNHDQDARVPESIPMLTELFGQRVFSQEIGGVLVAAVDTNIENPVWIELFEKNADEAGKKVLEEKRKLQKRVIETVKNYDGPVVLVGHHPSRLIDAFAVRDNLLQESNIEVIIGGHTHEEGHFETPIKNKNGELIVMHVLESVTRYEKGKLVPPKVFALRLKDGVIGKMTTLRENQERFEKRYAEHLEKLNYLY